MSDDYSATRFYKVVSHENNGDTTVQYAAYRDQAAVLFALGDPATNGYTASSPVEEPDPEARRPATVLYIFKNLRHPEDLQEQLAKILNLDFMDELPNRPPIGDVVNASSFPGDQLLLGELLT